MFNQTQAFVCILALGVLILLFCSQQESFYARGAPDPLPRGREPLPDEVAKALMTYSPPFPAEIYQLPGNAQIPSQIGQIPPTQLYAPPPMKIGPMHS